jgi:hypothetical protein
VIISPKASIFFLDAYRKNIEKNAEKIIFMHKLLDKFMFLHYYYIGMKTKDTKRNNEAK